MSLTKDQILSATSSYEILNHFLARYNPSGQRLVPGKHISNPFLAEKQKTPSFNIYFSQHSREWRYKDFATGDDGSCFDLVMRLSNLSFSEALQSINSEMCLNISDACLQSPVSVSECSRSRLPNEKNEEFTGVNEEFFSEGNAEIGHSGQTTNSIFTPFLHPSAKTIEYGTSSLVVRQFTSSELEWWKLYGISDVVLQQFRVSSAQSFSATNKDGKQYQIESRADNPVFAYVREHWAKLYRPLSDKYRFQYLGQKPSDYLFGFEQLPDFSEHIFITGGEKDVMSLTAHGFAAVSLNSETASLSTDILNSLQARCKHLFILYDIDATGLHQSEKLSKQHGLKRIVLPSMEGGKDISDFFKLQLSVETFTKLISEALQTANCGLPTEQELSRLDRVLKTREELAVAKARKIIFSSPILRQKDNPVFFPKTINVVQGKAGVHKSRLAQIICSSLLKTSYCTKELLGFTADPFKSYAICYVDTERNLSEQLPYALQQIQVMAGYDIEDNPNNFDYISLLEFERKERFDVLNEYLDHVRTKYNRHILIVLDVITDCVYNFNDAKDSMALIDMMNISINRYDVTFLCLIHENPGSTDKARGHLGTEIMNKASTVIQVGFERDHDRRETDLLKVAYLKCRSSKKHDPFYVKYSDTENTLVMADSDTIAEYIRTGKKRLDVNSVMDHLEIILSKSIPRREMLDNLMAEFNCSERFVEDYIRQIITEKSTLTDQHGRTCYLFKSKQGKSMFYSLQPINEQQVELDLVESSIPITADEAPF